MKAKSSVIFDLDGTLLNTLEDLKDATNAALESKGHAGCAHWSRYDRYVGNGVRKLMIRAVPDGERNPLFEETFAAFKEYYGAALSGSHSAISGYYADDESTEGKWCEDSDCIQ